MRDGSGMSLISSNAKDMYIIYAYPEITGSLLILKDIIGTVVETDITHIVTEDVCDRVYGVDIIVQLGNAKFYTCSKFVNKL